MCTQQARAAAFEGLAESDKLMLASLLAEMHIITLLLLSLA